MITLKKTGIFMQYNEECASISSLKGNSREFIGEELPIFKLLLRDEMGESQEVNFEDMRFVSAHSTENSMEAIYEGETLEVVVSASIGDSVGWKIAVHMKDNRIVEWIDFPRVAVPHELTLVLNENGDIAWNWGWRELDDIPNQDDIITFVKNANMWRQGIGKKYLHSGNMVKPYKVLCDNNLIYAPKGHEFVIEKIHTSAWETESGQYGQFLINYNPEEVECEICLPDGRYKLYEDDHNFVMIQGGCQKINVKKLSTVMIERE